MQASVPEVTRRTISSDGTASHKSCASSTSPGVGAPKLMPRAQAAWMALTTSGQA